jgi:hypothetical protein
VWPHAAVAEAFLVFPLLAQLLLNGESPWFFGVFSVESAAWFVLQFQSFCPTAEVGLPALGNWFQPLQGPLTPPVNSGADQRHLDVKSVEQRMAFGAGGLSLAPKLAALSQQPVEPCHQIGIDRFELQHDAVKPLPAQTGFASHQIKIQGAEADAAQRTNQVELPIQQLSVRLGLTASLAPQFQFQTIPIPHVGPDQGLWCVPLDQVAIIAAAMGAQAAQQLNRLEQVGLANAIGSDHQQAWLRQFQLQNGVVPEALQLEPVEPDGCWGDQ